MPKCEHCGNSFKGEEALYIRYTKAHNKGYHMRP
jgi:hypothetical protein